jgi:hypothetical protein
MEPLDSDSNLVEIEKGLVIEEMSFNLEEFQAVRIPPEALEASNEIKFCKEEGRKVDDLNWLIADSLVFCNRTISKQLLRRVSLTISHFLESPRPLTFQLMKQKELLI